MRQRLGLAAAMLGDPTLLVLDEPTNGLDPPGVRWLRGYVRRLADEGRTVLLSSHALSEVELTADHVLVLAQGSCFGRRRSPSSAPRQALVLGYARRTRTGSAPCSTPPATPTDGPTTGSRSTRRPREVGEIAAAHGVVLHASWGPADLEQAFFHIIEQSDTAAQPAELRS